MHVQRSAFHKHVFSWNVKEQHASLAHLQVEAAKVQEELAAASFEGFSEDETVCVTMTGNQEPTGCDITEEVGQHGYLQL